MKKTFRRQTSLGNFTSGKQQRRSSTNSVQITARKTSLTTFTNNNPDQPKNKFRNFSTLPTDGKFKKRTSTKTSYVLQSPYKAIDEPVDDDVFAPVENLVKTPEPEQNSTEAAVTTPEEASGSDKSLLQDDLHVKV